MPKMFLQGVTNNVKFDFSVGDITQTIIISIEQNK